MPSELSGLDAADRWVIESAQQNQRELISKLVEVYKHIKEECEDPLYPSAILGMAIVDSPALSRTKLGELLVMAIGMLAGDTSGQVDQ
jgi:hypothetical protein